MFRVNEFRKSLNAKKLLNVQKKKCDDTEPLCNQRTKGSKMLAGQTKKKESNERDSGSTERKIERSSARQHLKSPSLIKTVV